jgi:misacylated tRNA(Ala) deacylase
MPAQIVGALKCQTDSYLRSFETECLECKDVGNGKYEVVLADTVLFPTGGGQLNDTGTINGVINVLDVKRRDLVPVHVVDEEVQVGSKVLVDVNWERRFDAMQQHSGQHLLSARADKLLNWKTVGWSFGYAWCTVELDCNGKQPNPEDIRTLQVDIQRIIDEGIKFSVLDKSMYDQLSSKESERVKELDVDGISAKAVGSLRWIHIDSIDLNACCGTHVNNSTDLKSVVLSPVTEKVRGKNYRLSFRFGDRARRYLQEQFLTNVEIAKSLKCKQQDIVEMVNRLQIQLKDVMKQSSSFGKSLIPYLSADIAKQVELSDNKILAYADFEIQDNQWINSFVFDLATGFDPTGESCLLVALGSNPVSVFILGNSEKVQSLSEHITSCYEDIKGGYQPKLKRWQGKIKGSETSWFSKVVKEKNISVFKQQ